jgi:hypothetical protein
MSMGQAEELQLFQCSYDPVANPPFSFVLTFLGETTTPLFATSTHLEVERAIQQLPSAGDVTVRYLSATGTVTTFCDASGAGGLSSNIVEVGFLTRHGE